MSKIPNLSMAAIECAARMKSLYDTDGNDVIPKFAVGVNVESVYAELERAHIIQKCSDPSFVIFLPEGYESALTVH